MQTFDGHELTVINECSRELLTVLKKYFPKDAGSALCCLISNVVHISDSLGMDREVVVKGIIDLYAAKQLIEADLPNEFIN